MQEAAVFAQCLTKDKKVIPLYWQCGRFWTTNVKLPDLLVINRGLDAVTITSVEITGMAAGRKVAVNYFADDIPDFVRQASGQFKKALGCGVLSEVRNAQMAAQLGVLDFANTKLSDSEAVGPGESAVLLLSQAIFFSHTGLARVDGLRVKVSVKQKDETRTLECPIAFTPYQSKGDYIFPLKGDLWIGNLPTNLEFHRSALSQEFGFDIRIANPIEDGEPRGTDRRSPTKLSDYAIYHQEVMAVGNGVVIETGDQFPESLMSEPSAFSHERFNELAAQLEPKIGYVNSVCGNYVVIDHENGEFTFYAHLSEGTLRVKPGDRVSQGDVIAAVGNTGHSSEPHLHFHLMDSSDFPTANGLPIMFRNVPPTTINQFCKEANSLSATDYIFLRISK